MLSLKQVALRPYLFGANPSTSVEAQVPGTKPDVDKEGGLCKKWGYSLTYKNVQAFS